MNLRKFIGIVSSVVSLSFTCDPLLQSIDIKCNKPSVIVPSLYVSGKGRELIECVEYRIRTQYEKIRDSLDVRDTTFPRLTYGVLKGIAIATYNSSTDIITIDTSRVPYSDGKTWCNFWHELTHPLLSRKSQEIGNGRWPRYSTENRLDFSLDDYGMQLVSEGLATYIGNGERNRNNVKWPVNLEELYCSNQHLLGNNLVVSIMDEFGAEAIPIILRNNPGGSEVFRPRAWQDRIRREISVQRRNNAGH